MCDQPDKFDFHVPDEIWKAVVPPEFHDVVVCLYCFDEEAARKEIDYAPAIDELHFAGRGANFQFEIRR